MVVSELSWLLHVTARDPPPGVLTGSQGLLIPSLLHLDTEPMEPLGLQERQRLGKHNPDSLKLMQTDCREQSFNCSRQGSPRDNCPSGSSQKSLQQHQKEPQTGPFAPRESRLIQEGIIPWAPGKALPPCWKSSVENSFLSGAFLGEFFFLGV